MKHVCEALIANASEPNLQEWVELPINEEDFDCVLERLRTNEDNPDEPVDYIVKDSKGLLSYISHEWDPISVLNSVAEILQKMDSEDLLRMEKLSEYYNWRECLQHLRKSKFFEASDPEDLGLLFWENGGYADEFPEGYSAYIDLYKLGEALIASEGLKEVENGYLFVAKENC